MSVYETEEEQVESLKKWWRENGRSVIAGAAIGLGAVFGWRWWVDHRQERAEQASAAFEQILVQAASKSPDAALAQSQLVVKEFGSSPYAAFATLVTAQTKYQKGDKDGARADLEQTIEKAPDPAIRTIAVLRLARLLLDQGNAPAAAALMNRYPPSPAFSGDHLALSGDIALAQGDTLKASQAYTEALQKSPSSASLIQIKLDNLPPAG